MLVDTVDTVHVNVSGWAAKQARLARPAITPARSLRELLEQRCPQRNASDLVVLRVPKAGSTSLVEVLYDRAYCISGCTPATHLAKSASKILLSCHSIHPL